MEIVPHRHSLAADAQFDVHDANLRLHLRRQAGAAELG
jgi:hypothetical protein